MHRENDFEATIKWFLYGASGIVALFQLIMLFSEFTYYGSIGILFNGLYHLVGLLCPIMIIIIFIKDIDDREVYASYGLALFNVLSAIVDVCLLIKYILATRNTEGLKGWLIFLIVLLIGIELYYSVILVWYGLDKVTSVFVLLLSIFIVFYRGIVVSSVDSKFITFAYKTVKQSVFSIWQFMFLMFYLALIVCLLLYLDYRSLLEVIQNPKELFSKNTLFGTYTNLYINNTQTIIDDKNNNPISSNIVEASNNSNNYMTPIMNNNIQDIYVAQNPTKSCPLCGNEIHEGQDKCLICGYVFSSNNI